MTHKTLSDILVYEEERECQRKKKKGKKQNGRSDCVQGWDKEREKKIKWHIL